MRQITHEELLTSPVSFVGALDFDKRPAGISPRRLPDWTRLQVPPAMEPMVRMPSGVRLVFATNSTRVHLKVQTTRLVTPPREPRDVVFDLAIDGDETRTRAHNLGNTIILNPLQPEEWELVRGDPYTVQFEDLGTGEKQCELWLPANAFVEVMGLALDDGATLAAADAGSKIWLHHGSSISHCMEAAHPLGTWPAVAAKKAGVSVTNLGLGGNCHLDPFVARTMRDLPADLISLKVGINIINMDSMRERVFLPALHGFLDTIREGKPDTPILVISPIYCRSAETTPGPTVPDREGRFVTFPGYEEIRAGCMTLTRVRELAEETVRQRIAAGDANLGYMDGLTLFGEADAGDLPDDLHPNPEGYERMGERFAELALSGDRFLHPGV